MVIALGRPEVSDLDDIVGALRGWQNDIAPMQLHPGDVGWFWRFGAPATAAALRTWSRDGRIVAVGLLDGPTLLRMTIAPDLRQDQELTRHLVIDMCEPERGVLPAGEATVEAPMNALIQDWLAAAGWSTGERWTPLLRELAEPVGDPGVRIVVVGPEHAQVRAELQRASFDASTFTAEYWHAMAAGVLYADARCLIAYDDRGIAVAVATVWSAGANRPGLIEPLGVAAEHRRRGFGTAITLAASAALRELGASSVLVCTPSANVAAVATYLRAGLHPLGEIRDLCRLD